MIKYRTIIAAASIGILVLLPGCYPYPPGYWVGTPYRYNAYYNHGFYHYPYRYGFYGRRVFGPRYRRGFWY